MSELKKIIIERMTSKTTNQLIEMFHVAKESKEDGSIIVFDCICDLLEERGVDYFEL